LDGKGATTIQYGDRTHTYYKRMKYKGESSYAVTWLYRRAS